MHFFEVVYTAAGQRIMNVATNGVTKITGFDIFAATGGMNKAVTREISTVSNASGQVSVVFSATSSGADPKICGIEIIGNVTRSNEPMNLTGTPSALHANLTWQAPAFPTGTIAGYVVYQNGVKITPSPITATTYRPGQDSPALTPSTAYTFVVKTVVNGQESTGVSVAVMTTQQTSLGQLTVAIIGDSLTAHMDPDRVLPEDGWTEVPAAFRRAGWGNTWFRAVSGKYIAINDGSRTTMQNIQDCRNALGRDPDLWVIALGTNDIYHPSRAPDGMAADMQKVFNALGPNSKLMWVNIQVGYTTPQAVTANTIIAQKINARPHSAVADWYGYLGTISRNGIWGSDNFHHSPYGYDVRDTYMAETAATIYPSL